MSESERILSEPYTLTKNTEMNYVSDINFYFYTNPLSLNEFTNSKILLHVHTLLGNVLVNKFPRRQFLGKVSVARLRNKRGTCVFRVRGDVTLVDSDHVTCVSCDACPFLGYISDRIRSVQRQLQGVIAAEAREQASKEIATGSL
jgi:hypothetical protein